MERPVANMIFIPFAFNILIASVADSGIRCVLKLNNVPSMSKNTAFIVGCTALSCIVFESDILLL